MAVTITAQNLSKHFGARSLFRGVALSVDDRERVALIGPNGSGKSTLLKILAGIGETDEGTVTARKGLRAAYVAQADAFAPGATVLSAVARSLADARLAHLHDEHEVEAAAEQVLRRVGFENLQQAAASLSGGQRKRLSIARELAKEPDLLMLDEPTNHLDVEGIEWLEEILRQGSFASIVVTHDREFLEGVATRIVELAAAYPSGTLSVSGNYSEFLRRKAEFLEGQARREQALAGVVKEDIRWLTRGVQARRTKAKSRADSAYERMDELAELRARNAPPKAAAIDFSATERRTQKLLVARGLCKALGGKPLFADLDVWLGPGMKLGLMGPNGSGKSTLIKVLMGEVSPDAPGAEALAEEERIRGQLPHGTPALGTVQRAEKLRTVVFSQHRTELDPNDTLGHALSPVDTVVYRGRPIHIVTWAAKFLFTRDQLVSPISSLSGGEQARVHIARLMMEPADLLILDEPTNDLDIPSLEVLEESLEDFPGAVVLVTHDRAMLSRLASQVLALDGRGGARYFADYEQWRSIHEQEAREAAAAARREAKAAPASSGGGGGPAPKKKLSYKEQNELAQMEGAIEKAEAEVVRLEAAMADQAVIADHRRFAQVCADLSAAQQMAAQLYARWEELEAKK